MEQLLGWLGDAKASGWVGEALGWVRAVMAHDAVALAFTAFAVLGKLGTAGGVALAVWRKRRWAYAAAWLLSGLAAASKARRWWRGGGLCRAVLDDLSGGPSGEDVSLDPRLDSVEGYRYKVCAGTTPRSAYFQILDGKEQITDLFSARERRLVFNAARAHLRRHAERRKARQRDQAALRRAQLESRLAGGGKLPVVDPPQPGPDAGGAAAVYETINQARAAMGKPPLPCGDVLTGAGQCNPAAGKGTCPGCYLTEGQCCCGGGELKEVSATPLEMEFTGRKADPKEQPARAKKA